MLAGGTIGLSVAGPSASDCRRVNAGCLGSGSCEDGTCDWGCGVSVWVFVVADWAEASGA